MKLQFSNAWRTRLAPFLSAIIRTLLTLCVAGGIWGCGGGSDVESLSFETPQVTVSERPNSVTSAPTIASVDASQFFSWAESAFPTFFPETSSNLGPANGEYVYRFYPSTGNFLAVLGERTFFLGPSTGGLLVPIAKLSELACRITGQTCSPVVGVWNFVFSPDVSTADRLEITSGFERSRTLAEAAFGLTVKNFNVFVTSDAERMSDIYGQQLQRPLSQGRGTITAEVSAMNVFITRSADWTSRAPESKFWVIAHEYGHLIHNSLAGAATLDAPRWMTEGFGMYSQYLAEQASSRRSFDAMRSSALTASKSAISLQGFEGRLAMNAAPSLGYPLGFTGMDYLARNSIRGSLSLIDLWSAMGQGMTWQQAMLSVYGKSPDNFYREFEAWRATQ